MASLPSRTPVYSVFISNKDLGFQLALICVDPNDVSKINQIIGETNFRIEDLFVTRADGCILYETEPGVKSIFETPHPYIYGRAVIHQSSHRFIVSTWKFKIQPLK